MRSTSRTRCRAGRQRQNRLIPASRTPQSGRAARLVRIRAWSLGSRQPFRPCPPSQRPRPLSAPGPGCPDPSSEGAQSLPRFHSKSSLPAQTRLRIKQLPEAVTQPCSARGGPQRAGLQRRPMQRPKPRPKPRSGRAFTLVELLIVLSVLLILVTVAIPNYQQARNSALIKSIVGELMGYAKACTVINGSGVGATPTPPAVVVDRGGVEILQGCTAVNEGATLQASWGSARAKDVVCLNDRSLVTSSRATLTISAGNVLTCAFLD